MSGSKSCSKTQTGLRLPRELADRLAMRASENGRSLNAEIVFRLTASFNAEKIEDTIRRVIREEAHSQFVFTDAYDDAISALRNRRAAS